ncbi:MAG TPA: class I SAM-dependent methyltransferase [Alphaproteobacteria bacterium]|nr:class I SAM-dependent methyltransferase [Alphaproteobacteria bacterium]
MTPLLLKYLCDPVDQQPLKLRNPVYNKAGHIVSGILAGKKGREYPIVRGVPRFIKTDTRGSVDGFGDQWNYFNYDDFYLQWLHHTVKNTFGKPSYFKNKLVVDCGAGHGMQSRWMVEAGAKHVIAMELSHTVDDVMRKNLKGLEDKIDVIQCSIDQVPLRKNSIKGLVICHNVLQHTPNSEKTAKELWSITAPGGEFVFNSYVRMDGDPIRWLRHNFHMGWRRIISKAPFAVRLAYAHTMATLRFVPVLGWVLEKSHLMGRGEVIPGPNYFSRAYRAGLVITFDGYGGHTYQNHLSLDEQRALAKQLQPNTKKWENAKEYFTQPMPIGAGLRLHK